MMMIKGTAMARVAAAVAAVVLCVVAPVVNARPLVRNLRSNSDFQRLLKYHKEVTGLGVVVDFYSDGCGPCRQIAPHFKDLAKRYKDKVVFAKVDVNMNRETSSLQRIRSMPTFQIYQNGKKRHQFSGGDLQQLQSWAATLARDFKDNNVRVSRDTLLAFYEEHAPDKASEEQIDKVLAKAGGEAGGRGHRNLVKALKKKYGVGPDTELRYDPKAPKDKDAGKGKATPPPVPGAKTNKAKTKSSAKSNDPPKPNLHLASLEELEMELEARKAELEAQREEAGDDEDDDDDDEEGEAGEGGAVKFASFSPDPDGLAERVAIVGGGPAGLSAAVYAARAGLRPVVIAPPAGGQLQGKGVLIENYPGIATDMTGPAVVFEMQKQAAKYGAVFSDEMVVAAELSTEPGTPHKLQTNSTTILAHTVIVSTGADSNWLEVPGEERFKGGGVSACATCDGYLYRDQEVVVIGGGDTAMEEALHLATMSSKVTVIHRRDSFSKASVILAERVLNHPKIDVMWNATVVEFEGRAETPEERAHDPHVQAEGADLTEEQPLLTHVRVQRVGSDAAELFPCSGAFVAIGHTPNTWLFKEQLSMDAVGYLHVETPSTRTSVQGVFAAGDVADPTYRQAVTSAGTGAMAALDAEHWLQEHGIEDERKALDEALMREVLEELESERARKLDGDDQEEEEACDEPEQPQV